MLGDRVRTEVEGRTYGAGAKRIKIQRAVPKLLYGDNGREFSSQAMDLWAYQNEVRMAFSRPGKPTDNALVESFNGTFRTECPGRALVHVVDGDPAGHEDLAAGVQREPVSKGSWGEDTHEFADTNSRKLTLGLLQTRRSKQVT
jgi:transposase InsO family protein